MAQANKITIKASHNGDIRRITVDDTIGFKDLKKIVTKLFKPAYSFNIRYYDEEDDLINIKSDLDLKTAIKHARRNVLRLNIEAVNILKTTESLTDTRIDDGKDNHSHETVPLLGKRDEQPFHNSTKMEELILQTILSKQVLDALTEKLLPNVLEAVKMKLSEDKEPPKKDFDFNSFLMESVPKIEEPQDLLLSSTSITNEKEELVEEEYENSSSSSEDEEEAAENVPEENLENIETAKEQEAEDEIPELVDNENSENIQEENSEKVPEEEEDEPEAFVMMDKSESPIESPVESPSEKRDKIASSIRSILSTLFKSSKNRKPSPNGEIDEEEESIPVSELDEALAHLCDMGFSDTDSNRRVLKFHKKYNEGLEEVIDDLLMQYEGRQKEIVN